MKSIELNHISASGFEVFDKNTLIPIKPLTLLYGPNSAGKSAVEDILSLLQKLCTPAIRLRGEKSFDTDSYTRGERLSRCWRRESDIPLRRVESMSIGVEGKIVEDDPESKGIIAINWLKPSQLISIDFRFHIDQTSTENSIHPVEDYLESPRADFLGPVRRDFDIRVDGVLFFAFRDGQGIGLNIRHSGFGRHNLDSIHKTILKSDAFKQESQILWLLEDGVEFSPARLIRRTRGMVRSEHVVPGLNHAVRSVIELANIAVQPLFRAFSDKLISTMVPASRTIPSSENLAFLLERSPVGEDHPWFHIGAKGDKRYRKLAEAFANKLSSKGISRQIGHAYVNRVNGMLTSHLFGERGYFIDMDYRVVLTGDDLERISKKKPGKINLDDYAMLVRLFLSDAEGRHYAFSEVGSGLGYVFPVICEVSDSRSKMIQLQQPELHLHPSMQAGLGDVLLDTVKLHNNLIVETHSEHLLLRILKRIRQQKNHNAASSPANDIVVLYFEPKDRGRTEVHELRISENGDFMDRWPRGFFMERDAELWDE